MFGAQFCGFKHSRLNEEKFSLKNSRKFTEEEEAAENVWKSQEKLRIDGGWMNAAGGPEGGCLSGPMGRDLRAGQKKPLGAGKGGLATLGGYY